MLGNSASIHGLLFIHVCIALACYNRHCQDLWKTTSERVDGAEEGRKHEDIFNKLFGGTKEAVGSDAAAAALKALQEAPKSSTGLRRRHPDLPPRKRKGISLAEYLKQAQLQQETEGQ